MDNLRGQLVDLEQSQIEANKNRDKLANLYEKGIINYDGETKDE